MLGILLAIQTSPATGEGALDFTWLFIRMISALVVVCILAVIILKYAVPRIGFFKKYSGGKYIDVVARQNLDQRKHLYIIKVGERYALVGSSDHGVNLVMELKKEDIEY
jgi:flagellar biosynthetic protein FliO